MSVIRIYQYLSPVVLTPLSFYLWQREYTGDFKMTLIAWLIPILWAYILPGLGTNFFKVWEFDVRFKLGRFRPHHGFIFGSATSIFAWLCHAEPATTMFDVFRFALVMASVLGFWNLLYEVKALQSGILHVYNQPWAENKGPEAIAMDYAPWIFGGFGATYGMTISFAEYFAFRGGNITPFFAGLFIVLGTIVCLGIPVLGFMRASRKRHGHSGTRPVERRQG